MGGTMRQQGKGLLIVVSGPAGVGKGTVDGALIARNPGMRMSVSATTRKPRPGEIDGVHYFFRTEGEFRRMIDKGEFLEYVRVFNTHYYGTPRSFVDSEINDGHDVILEIDVQGAMKVREAYPDAVLLFIAPPSLSTLKSRLIGRGTESLEAIEKRFATAFSELEMMDRYDYIIVNEVVDVAVASMECIVNAEKLRASRRQDLIAKLMKGSEESL